MFRGIYMFKHDDTVEIIAGKHAGKRGWIRKTSNPNQFKVVSHSAYPLHNGTIHKDNLKACKNPETNEEVELDEVLNIQQRRKRALIIKRYKAKIQRARELSKRKMAPAKNINKRAFIQARKIVRTRIAGKRGAAYAELGPAEKMVIDKAVSNKKELIKKIALRLVPRVKQAEQARLHSFMKGRALKSVAPAEGKANGGLHEDVNDFFFESFSPYTVRSTRASPAASDDMGMGNKSVPDKPMSKKAIDGDKDGVDKDGLKLKNKGVYAPGNKNIIQYTKFEEEVALESNAYKALIKKAESSGIEIEILGEIYNRGCNSWQEESNVSQQQYAFARVNSFINKGQTYFNEDADLQNVEESAKLYQDKAYGRTPTREKRMPSYASIQKAGLKTVTESNNTPYIKPHFGNTNNPTVQTGWKSSNRHGKVKFFGKDFQHAAIKHANGVLVSSKPVAGNSQNVKTFKKDTPYSEEIDNAFAASFGEEVRSADRKGVIVHRTDGTSYIRNQKVNRKIIKSGNVIDGQPAQDGEDVST